MAELTEYILIFREDFKGWLQGRDLTRFTEWAVNWQMKSHVDKCKAMHIDIEQTIIAQKENFRL